MQHSMILKDQNTRDHRERGSHARGAYPTQYTSRIGTARMKQEEEEYTSNMKSGREERGHEGEKSQKSLTSAKKPYVIFASYYYNRLCSPGDGRFITTCLMTFERLC